MTKPFTSEYVEGLRRENQRKGARIRELEEVVREIRAEFVRIAGREPSSVRVKAER